MSDVCKNAILQAKPYTCIRCTEPLSLRMCRHLLGHVHNQIMYNKHINSVSFPVN